MNQFISDKLSDVSSIAENIETGVGIAVQSLQFEDISRQLCEYIATHLDQVRNCYGVLYSELNTLDNEADNSEEIMDALSLVNSMLSEDLEEHG